MIILTQKIVFQHQRLPIQEFIRILKIPLQREWNLFLFCSGKIVDRGRHCVWKTHTRRPVIHNGICLEQISNKFRCFHPRQNACNAVLVIHSQSRFLHFVLLCKTFPIRLICCRPSSMTSRESQRFRQRPPVAVLHSSGTCR